MPVKDPSEGCHGIKEAAILAALQRIRLCEAAAELLDKLAQRLQTRWTACSRSLRPWGGLRVSSTSSSAKVASCLSTPGGSKAEAGW